MKMRMSRAVPALAAAVVTTVTLAATPALASTSAPAPTPRPSAVTALPTAAQPATTNCDWYSPAGYGTRTYLGTIICDYGTNRIPLSFPNGTVEVFAIGTSHAIWTAWDNTSGGWSRASMGGLAYSGVTIYQNNQNPWILEITVYSSSGGLYCNFRGGTPSSGWSGWTSHGC